MYLSELIARLQTEVPAVENVPTESQYEQAIKDAVTDFSRRCGLKKFGTLTIVAGTASYALPADFMRIILLETLMSSGGVLHSTGGLIAVPATFEESYTISNGTITFKPTPTYSMARDYSYIMKWILTAIDGYPDLYEYAEMGEDEAQIVLLKAKGICYDKIANSMASSGTMKYSLGAVSVDKGGGTDEIVNRSYKLHGEYVDACDAYNGRAILAGGK